MTSHHFRSTSEETSRRIDAAAQLLEAGHAPVSAAAQLSQHFGVTVRQARRYVQAVRAVAGGRRQPMQEAVSLKPAERSGVCYVVQHDQTGLFKIGASCDFDSRRSALGVGTVCTLLRVWACVEPGAEEKRIHEELAAYRLPCSEWFACSMAELEAAVSL